METMENPALPGAVTINEIAKLNSDKLTWQNMNFTDTCGDYLVY